MADDDDDLLHVKAISPASQAAGYGIKRDKDDKQRKDHHQHHPRRRPREYFKTLAKATEASNKQLTERNIPVRFCVYKKDGRVMLDIAYLNEAGKISKLITRDITDGDFDQWIEDISNIEGIQFDQRA